MRFLLDHCKPRRLSKYSRNHIVKTTAHQGWERLRNGKLLVAASEDFDVLLTIDKNLKHQQNLATLPIALMVVLAQSNRLADLVPFVPAIELELTRLKPNICSKWKYLDRPDARPVLS